MPKTVSKSRRPQAERAAEHVLHEVYGCVVTHRAMRTKFASVDFFHSDCMGKRKDGRYVFAQATAGQSQAVRIRRRKLEEIPWGPWDTVLVLQLVETPNPANRRRKLWHFRVHEYDHSLEEWSVADEALEVKPEWFKARKG